MKRIIFLFLISCSKVDIHPKISVSPNPSQSNSYVNILLDIPDTLKKFDKYLIVHFSYKNSKERKVIKLSDEKIYQIYLPESLINYSVYLIVDTFNVKLEGIRVYDGSNPKEGTFFISSSYTKNDSEKLALIEKELKFYPNNIKAKAYYDCLKNNKNNLGEIYEIYYNICKDENDYKSIYKAIHYGDSSYEFLLKLASISDTMLEVASRKFPDDIEIQIMKLKKLNEKKRFNEVIIYSDFILQNLNMEWLYKFYPYLDHIQRNKKFFENFSNVYKLKALAYLELNDSLKYKENFLLYCLNYPNENEIYEECKSFDRFLNKIRKKERKK
jgi:hypothetical protein